MSKKKKRVQKEDPVMSEEEEPASNRWLIEVPVEITAPLENIAIEHEEQAGEIRTVLQAAEELPSWCRENYEEQLGNLLRAIGPEWDSDQMFDPIREWAEAQDEELNQC